MTDSPVRFRRADDAAVITLDDGKANVLTMETMDALDKALDRAEAEAKAVVLVGREGRFSAGFDLKVMQKGPDAVMDLVGRGTELLLRLYAHPQPTVAACTGHAVAAGAMLLLACDTRVGAAGDYKIGLNETAIDLPLPLIGRELARDRLANHRLVEATVQATLYDPGTAARVGYLDEVMSPEDVLDEALLHASRLAKLSSRAYATTKRELRLDTIARVRATSAQDLRSLIPPPA